MRASPHWHVIILEGGIDNDGRFHSIPIKDTKNLYSSISRGKDCCKQQVPQKMAASISLAGEPDQKKNHRKNPKKIRLKLT